MVENDESHAMVDVGRIETLRKQCFNVLPLFPSICFPILSLLVGGRSAFVPSALPQP